MNGLPVLLLHTIGRKSGKQRVTPLGYFEHEGGLVVTGSNAGMNFHPGWYYNLTATPKARIQLQGYQLSVTTDVIEQGHYDLLWDTLTRIAPSYKNYTQRTNREIPILVLRVQTD